jgi:hypothetical protein
MQSGERVAVDGAFKAPGLRNVELTAPYFHNGGSMTLMDVVEYNRRGNFGRRQSKQLRPEHHATRPDVPAKADLVMFLLAPTDNRVRYQKASFDHPQLVGLVAFEDLDAAGALGSVSPLPKFPATPTNGQPEINPYVSTSTETICKP